MTPDPAADATTVPTSAMGVGLRAAVAPVQRSNALAAPIVETDGLTKRYGEFVALDHCDLRIAPGEVFGLLGPNGAGKTTLIRLLLGYLQPTSGQALICGLDCQRQSVSVRRMVGYLPAEARMPRHLRGRAVLEFLSQMHPGGSLTRALERAAEFDLDLTRRVAFMSTGMRQKLGLCAVLSLDVPLLILDEPTANLDPTTRSIILRHVIRARDAGRTVVFSSHVLSETEEVCERVVFVRSGRIALEQTMSELRQRHRIVVELAGSLPQPPEALARQIEVQVRPHDGWQLDVSGELTPVLHWLSQLQVTRMRIEPLGLRSVYEAVHHGDPSYQLDEEGRP